MKPAYTISILAFAILVVSCGGPRSAVLDAPDRYTVTLAPYVNTAADELAPLSTQAGLYLSSNREVRGEDDHRLYLLPAAAASVSDLALVKVAGGDLRSGAPCLAGGLVYFGQCYRDDGHGDCDVLTGTFAEDGLSIANVEALPLPLNDIEWDHHPAVSPDGTMYIFASERLRGLGGSDLWMCTLGSSGWSAPKLLGETINTTSNEMTPSFSADGRTLYFASDGRSDFGGFDLYASEYVNDRWSQPKVLPVPFNSEDDDLFLDGGPGVAVSFVASDREGGKGGFDIYRIERIAAPPPPPPPPPPPEVRQTVLRVVSENAFTRERIPAMITISDAGSDEQLGNGSGSAEVALTRDATFSVTATKSGFISAFVDIELLLRDGAVSGAVREGARDVVERVVFLVPVSEEERKIYAFTVEFDFDLFNIRPEEQRKLDSAAVLLELYPHSTVVVSGHTDSVGTDAYNIKLGYSRATEVSRYVATYLRGKNVNLRNPMEIRTYGETQHIAPNMTEEGRQRNRRVEIAIIRNK